MSNFPAYIIDFYMTVSGSSPIASIIVAPSLPSATSIQSSISKLIGYLKTEGINLNNFSLVNSSLTTIINNINTNLPSSSTLSEQITATQASSSDSTSLINNLQLLLTYINTNTSTNPSFISPEEDTQTASPPTYIYSLRNKKPQTTTSVTKFQSLGSKVSGMQTNANLTSSSLNTFITKVKNAVNEITNPNSTTSTTNPLITTTSNGRVTANPNFFGNLFSSFINNRPTNMSNQSRINNRRRNNRLNNSNTTQTVTSVSTQQSTVTRGAIHDLHIFNILAPTTDPTATASTVNAVADSYEVSTSQNGNVLMVTFSYFTAGSTTSTFACSYNLTMASLVSIANSAYNASLNLTSAEKQSICQKAGYSTSSTPSSLDLWISILICILSYLSFGVASQLGAVITIPYSGTTTGSANYMLNQNYINNVSNISLPIYLSTKDSSTKALLSTGILGKLSDSMYYDSSDSKSSTNSYGSAQTIANSIIDMMNANTATTTATST